MLLICQACHQSPRVPPLIEDNQTELLHESLGIEYVPAINVVNMIVAVGACYAGCCQSIDAADLARNGMCLAAVAVPTYRPRPGVRNE